MIGYKTVSLKLLDRSRTKFEICIGGNAYNLKVFDICHGENGVATDAYKHGVGSFIDSKTTHRRTFFAFEVSLNRFVPETHFQKTVSLNFKWRDFLHLSCVKSPVYVSLPSFQLPLISGLSFSTPKDVLRNNKQICQLKPTMKAQLYFEDVYSPEKNPDKLDGISTPLGSIGFVWQLLFYLEANPNLIGKKMGIGVGVLHGIQLEILFQDPALLVSLTHQYLKKFLPDQDKTKLTPPSQDARCDFKKALEWMRGQPYTQLLSVGAK